MDRPKFAASFAVVLGVLAALGVAAAFSYVSQPVTSTVPVNPPSGNLQVSGAWPGSYVINATTISSFMVKNSVNTNVVFLMNLTISEASVSLSDATVLMAGTSANQGCGVGVCWYTSASTYTLEPGQSMPFDVSLSFHRIATFNLSIKAVGNGG